MNVNDVPKWVFSYAAQIKWYFSAAGIEEWEVNGVTRSYSRYSPTGRAKIVDTRPTVRDYVAAKDAYLRAVRAGLRAEGLLHKYREAERALRDLC